MVDIIKILIYIALYVGLFTVVFYVLGFFEVRKPKTKLKTFPFVSFLIPAYNEENSVVKTIDSIENLDYPKNKFEIIFVNDGSTDNTLKLARNLQKKYSNLKVYTKKNGGKGSALNFGIKKAKAEILISFDADSMVERHALKNMLPYFEDPKVVAVTPVMKVYKPKGILQRVQAMEYDLGIFLRKAFSVIDAIHITPGPFSAYRREFFEKHGGYDEDNITEDMEVAMRAQSLNYKIENCLDAVVYTIAPNKFRALTRQRKRWYFGMIKNLWKYRKMFGAEYGELGIFILPLAVFSTIMTMIITGYHTARFISDAFKTINLYSSVGFDFITNLKFKWYLVSLNFLKFFSQGIMLFAILFILIIITIILVANKRVRSEDKSISIFISYVFFIFLYAILFSFWWIVAIISSITRKKIEW